MEYDVDGDAEKRQHNTLRKIFVYVKMLRYYFR